MATIWNDDNQRAELLNELDNRRNLVRQLGFCVRLVIFILNQYVVCNAIQVNRITLGMSRQS